MPSNQIPRGWHEFAVAASGAGGLPASISVPGSAGVVHVVTGVNAIMTYLAGASANLQSNIIASWAPVAIAQLLIPYAAAGKDTYSWSGEIAIPEGSPIIVAFASGTIAGEAQFLELVGYDI